jgi:hypothetical protein
MPLIPFPNIPNYPGVPSIPRRAPGSPNISISLASPQNPPAQTTPYADNWGIFNSVTGTALYTPANGGTLSFFSFSFSKKMEISDFPIEANSPDQGAAFASFNKVFTPANPTVTLAISGAETDKQGFLAALDDACESTNLYIVTTPEGSFGSYSIESYSYERTAQRGATMLTVDVSLKEILQVQPYYSNPDASTAINSPQSPSSVSQANGGLTQAQPYAGSSSGVISVLGGPN